MNLKLKEVVSEVADFVNMTDVRQILEARESEIELLGRYTFSADAYTKINRVVSAVNMAIEKIARNYVPFFTTQIVASDSTGFVTYSKLIENVLEVVEARELKRDLKSVVEPETDGFYVSSSGTSYRVKYSYVPSRLTMGDFDKTVSLPPVVSLYVLCYAVASELALATSCFDEAEIWKQKMQESFREARLPKREVRVGRRKFL